MSRTEGVSLPRLPTSHTRVTSSHAIQPLSARGAKSERHRRALSEPSYTAYVGSPRQDVPHHVYHNAAMYDDVFDKQGKLFVGRNTPKIVSPLNTIGYSSLHDPHCRKLFLNNRKLRSHLMSLGLITDDLKVVATTTEQRQKIRAHELLERKEQLILKLEQQEKQRLERLQQHFNLPPTYRETVRREEERRARTGRLESIKIGKVMKEEEKKQQLEERKKEEKRSKLKQVMEDAQLMEQAHRNSERAQQEFIEMAAYERMYNKYGKQLAKWHRDSDIIHNRMIMMERKRWAKVRNLKESQSHRGRVSDSREIDVETVPDPTLRKRSEQDIQEEEEQVASPTPQGSGVTFTVPEIVEQLEGESEIAAVENHTRADEVAEQQALQQPTEVQLLEQDTPAGEDGTAPVEEEEGWDVVEPAAVQRLLTEEEDVEVVVLDQEQSAQQFTQILVDTLQSVDYTQSGFLSVDDFVQVLDSRDLGLQLVEEELQYIAGQVDVYGNGWVPFIQLASSLLEILQQLYNERAQVCIEQYGGYTEEQWCQIYPPKGGVCYLHKLSGILQYGRPDDFRPTLKEDVFEESIVDFFETTDSNKDGVVDYEDFYALLLSPMVTTRIYSDQMEELVQLYQNLSFEGRMTLEQFAEVARVLLLMIYQNTYPDVEEWIELQCRKFGTFWFNKNTGETYLPESSSPSQLPAGKPAPTTQDRAVPSEEDRPAARKRQKKKSRKSTTSAEPQARPPGQTSPPPLRKRQSQTAPPSTLEQETTEENNIETEPSGDKDMLELNSPEVVRTIADTSTEKEDTVKATDLKDTVKEPESTSDYKQATDLQDTVPKQATIESEQSSPATSDKEQTETTADATNEQETNFSVDPQNINIADVSKDEQNPTDEPPSTLPAQVSTESSTQPPQDTELMTKPPKDAELMTKPLEDTELMAKPPKDAELMTKPLEDSASEEEVDHTTDHEELSGDVGKKNVVTFEEQN